MRKEKIREPSKGNYSNFGKKVDDIFHGTNK